MAAFTTKASGNWSDQTTWNEVGVPGDGDTITIQNNHEIIANTGTIVIGDDNVSVGYAINFSGPYPNNPSLTIIDQVILKVKGDVTNVTYGTQGKVIVSAGGTFAFFPASGASLKFYAQPYILRLICNGLSNNYATVTTDKSRGGNNSYIFPKDSTVHGVLTTAIYTHFSNLGDSTHSGLITNAFSVFETAISITFCTFTDAGHKFANGDNPWNSNYILEDNLFSGPTDPIIPSSLLLSFTPTTHTGTLSVQRNLFLDGAVPNFSRVAGINFINNYYDSGIASDRASAKWGSFDGNFIRQPAAIESYTCGDVTNNYFYNDATGSGSFFLISFQTPLDISGNIFEYAGTTTDSVYCVGLTEGSSFSRVVTLSGNLVIPNAGELCAHATESDTGSPIIVHFYHNTMICGSSAGILIDRGSGGTEVIGSLGDVKSNLFYASISNSFYAITNIGAPGTGEGIVTDIGNGNDIDYNAISKLKMVPIGTWSNAADGTPYNTPLTNAPGVHDISIIDPQFVEPTRNLLTWGASVGKSDLSSTLTYLQNNLTKITSELIPWVRSGFAPTNPALHNAAHDGTDIGAVPYSNTIYTLTAPTIAKGDVTIASGDFTVTPNANYTGTITPNSSLNGIFTPTLLTWSGTSEAKTFTFTPRLVGINAISTTNSGGLINPSSVNYLGMVQLGSSGTASQSGSSAAGNRAPSFGAQDFYANGTWLPELKRDISNDPVDPSNADLFGPSFFGATPLHLDFSATGPNTGTYGGYGIPFNIVPGTQPLKVVNRHSYPATNGEVSQAFPSDGGDIPIPDMPSMEGWVDATLPSSPPPPGSDRHMLIGVRNETTGLIDTIWELYQVWTTDNGITWEAEGTAKFDITTGHQRTDDVTSAEEGGMIILPALLHYDEVQAVIDGIKPDLGHAIRVTMGYSGAKYVWPARAVAGVGGYPSMAPGGRARLSAAWYNANASNYTGQARVIIDAIRKYGLIMADNGGNLYVGGVTDDRWNTNEIYNLVNITGADLELIKYIPGWTHSGPTSGPVGVPQTFTVSRNPSGAANYGANIYLNTNSSVITLTDANPSGTYTFTPPSSGTYTLDGAPGGQEWYPPPPIVFTAITPFKIQWALRPSSIGSGVY